MRKLLISKLLYRKSRISPSFAFTGTTDEMYSASVWAHIVVTIVKLAFCVVTSRKAKKKKTTKNRKKVVESIASQIFLLLHDILTSMKIKLVKYKLSTMVEACKSSTKLHTKLYLLA